MSETESLSIDRRVFLKSAGVAVTTGWTSTLRSEEVESPIPHRPLGRTGVNVPVIGVGTAPAGFRGRKEATQLFSRCLDRGLTYFDTAPQFAGYGEAQVALGDVLRTRRDEAFVVTKCFEPDGEKALALLKQNLRELQTERADVVFAHSIGSDTMDLQTVLGERGVMRALEKAQRDGLTRNIGISGHNRPQKCLAVLREFEMQVMMNAVSYVSRHIYDFETTVWSEAHERGVALVAMKVFGGIVSTSGQQQGSRIPREDLQQAFRYAQSLPNISTVVVGMQNADELNENLAWARQCERLEGEELKVLLARGAQMASEWGTVYGPTD